MRMTVMTGEQRSDGGCLLWYRYWYVVNDNYQETAYYPRINSRTHKKKKKKKHF